MSWNRGGTFTAPHDRPGQDGWWLFDYGTLVGPTTFFGDDVVAAIEEAFERMQRRAAESP